MSNSKISTEQIATIDEFDDINSVLQQQQQEQQSLTQSQLNCADLTVEHDGQSNENTVRLFKASPNISLCKKLMKFMFSNVGLVVILCVYAAMGAFMFRLLEQHEELRLCEEGNGKITKAVQDLRENLVHYVIYNATENGNGMYTYTNKTQLLAPKNGNHSNKYINAGDIQNTSKISETVDEMLKEFRDYSFKIESKYKYNGQNCVNDSKWRFSKALEFCITVITTIGYGHITPTTWEGQVVTICYATIGIPIFLITIANLSGAFSNMFIFAYVAINKINPFKKKKVFKEKKANSVSANLDQILANENRTNPTLPYSPSLNEFILKEIVNPETSKNDMDNNSDDDSIEDDDDDDDEVKIPTMLILVFVFLYILFGALIFKYYENWKFVESFYFITVSITSIGFGDFIPGQKSGDRHAAIKYLTIGFYSLFGVAIIGMSIGLMQDAAKRTFKKIVLKCKKFFYNKKMRAKMTTLDSEREKQEIVNRIRMLKNYQTTLNLRKRNV